jgi:hypothetical protein
VKLEDVTISRILALNLTRNDMKNKKYYTNGTNSKFNCKIVERGKFVTVTHKYIKLS